MFKNTIAIVLFFCILALEGIGQQASVSGVIHDAKSGQPVEFATVALLQVLDSALVSGAATNAEGEFSINKIQPGNYWLRVQFIGYRTLTLGPYSLNRGDKQNVGTVSLQSDAAMLDELEVRGEAMTANFKLDRQVYKAANFADAEGGTAFDLLRNMPGVSTTAEGAISLRGFLQALFCCSTVSLYRSMPLPCLPSCLPMPLKISKSLLPLLPATMRMVKQVSST
jgi:hypothetical protein